MPLAEPRQPIQLPDSEVGDEHAEAFEPEAVGGDRHDTVRYQTIPKGVKATLPEVEPAPDDAPVVLRSSPVADRIRAYVDERQRAEPNAKPKERYSLRKLSVAAGLGPTQLTMILRRLDDGADIGSTVLGSVAAAMGRSLDWLMRGEDSGVRLRDVEGWDEAVAQARATYPNLTDRAIGTAGEIILPRAPTKKLDPARMLAFIVGVDVLLGER